MAECKWHDDTVPVIFEVQEADKKGPDVYRIKPKPLQMHYFWSQPSATFGLKYTSIASIFQENALNAARPLSRIWRVGFLKEAKEITPRKPLYFFKESVSLLENEVIRLV
ncbi:Uncharacterized protein SCF082_LOCUS19015 [Durusdinium trenchii]|uniref:Uncharacterized protein n=1 Tax=Durusdinium trenchii TaxID=1381693 RepID=A0ABP0KSW5_9DINO